MDETKAPSLTYSPKWRWVDRVNVLVVAILIAQVMRGKTGNHLIPRDAFGVLAFVTALVSAFGTFCAVDEDINEHGVPGRRRPDHYGSRAWQVYMGSVLLLYAAFFAMFTGEMGLTLAWGALFAQLPLFGLAWLGCLWALMVDERKMRGILGLAFPAVAIMMGGASLTPYLHKDQDRAYTRACYANQKTIAGAVEMYNLDRNTKRVVLDPAFYESLRSGGYLQSIPEHPGSGPNTAEHFQLKGTSNGIRCTVHGEIQ